MAVCLVFIWILYSSVFPREVIERKYRDKVYSRSPKCDARVLKIILTGKLGRFFQIPVEVCSQEWEVEAQLQENDIIFQ